jgi:hypothetical protein
MTYQIPQSTGLTLRQKAALNLISVLCLAIAGAVIPESISGQLPSWILYIPTIASTIPQFIQLFLSGRLDPVIALAIPELQVLLAQAKQQTPGTITNVSVTSTAPLPGTITASTIPAATSQPAAEVFVNPTFNPSDI